MTGPGALVGGRYRLVRRLAAGGMGSVWEAMDERLHRPVAVKQLHVQPGLSPEAAELAVSRAMREARITARLHHPNAVPVYDVVDQDGLPCLIMQYLPSTSLSELLREKGSLVPSVVARIGAEVAAALAAAHELGIVHRDVKPGNVLIAEDGSAKVTDFGVSHAVGDVSLTSTGLVTGTPAFLAPEVARGAEAAFSADVFGLGATLYDALEGQPPFGHDDNPMAMLHKAASGQVVPPRQSGPLAPLVMRMLAADPRSRPPMIDVARTLAALAADIDAAPPLTERMPPASATRRMAPVVAPVVAPTSTLPAAGTAGVAGAGVAGAFGAAAAGDVPPPGRVARPAGGPPPRSNRTGVIAVVVVLLVILAALGALLLVRHNRNNGAAPGTTSGASATVSPPRTSASRSSRPATTSATTPSQGSSAPPSTQSSSVASTTPPPTTQPATSTPPSAPAGGASAAQLASAITDYYGLLPSDTNDAWNRLTKNYQQGTAKNRKNYQDFWSAISEVDVSNATGSAPNSASATITYHYKDGRVVVEQTSYGLVSDGGQLKIDSSQVQNSRTQ